MFHRRVGRYLCRQRLLHHRVGRASARQGKHSHAGAWERGHSVDTLCKRKLYLLYRYRFCRAKARPTLSAKCKYFTVV